MGIYYLLNVRLPISFLGLLLDIYGSFWLVKSIIVSSKRTLKLKTTSFWDGNPYLKATENETRYNSFFGFAFLILGFVGQACFQIKPLTTSVEVISIVFLGAVILGIIVHYKVLKYMNSVIPKEFKDQYGEIK